VYWRRRIVVLLVLIGMLLLALVLMNALRQGTGSSGASRADQSPATPSATGPSATASSATVPSLPAPTSSALPGLGEPMECADDAIEVSATTDSSTYRAGEGAVLTLGITNVSDAPCLRDIGPKANELLIKSGGYHVWSSDDCSAGAKSKVATLQPGERFVSTISWDGLMSGKGCPQISKVAKAGRYELIGRNGRVTSESTPFSIRRKSG